MSMKPHVLAGAAVAVLLFMCVSVVHADGGQWYLLTPRMVVRMNLSDSPLVRDIGVRNTDVEPVDVTIQPANSLSDVVAFNDTELNFTLSPNETRRINFTIAPKEAGNYSGDVMVLFTSRTPNVTNGALASEIYIFASGEPLNGTLNGSNSTSSGDVTGKIIGLEPVYFYAGIAGAIIVALAIILMLRRRG